MTKKKTLKYTDKDGIEHDIPLFDTELSLSGSDDEQYKKLAQELELDNDVKKIAKKIINIKQKDWDAKDYYNISILILRLLKKHGLIRSRTFKNQSNILERIAKEVESQNNNPLPGASSSNLKSIKDFAKYLKKEDVRKDITWSLYFEVLGDDISEIDRTQLINEINNKELTDKYEIRKRKQKYKK